MQFIISFNGIHDNGRKKSYLNIIHTFNIKIILLNIYIEVYNVLRYFILFDFIFL